MASSNNKSNGLPGTYNKSSKVLLKSLDGTVFEANVKAAKQCGTLKTMLEDCEMGRADADGVIPLMKVHSNTLQKILKWVEHHQDDEEEPVPQPANRVIKPVDPLDTTDESLNNIPAWDVEFMANLDQSGLMDVLLAANYLDLRGLMRLACKTVAKMIQMKDPDHIRSTFNIADEQPQANPEKPSGSNHGDGRANI